jgi:hypothetical protein
MSRAGSHFRLRIWLARASGARCRPVMCRRLVRGLLLCLRGRGRGALCARGTLVGCVGTGNVSFSVALLGDCMSFKPRGVDMSHTLRGFVPCACFARALNPSPRCYSALWMGRRIGFRLRQTRQGLCADCGQHRCSKWNVLRTSLAVNVAERGMTSGRGGTRGQSQGSFCRSYSSD